MRKRLLSLFIFLSALTCGAASAATVPKLHKGIGFSEARAEITAAGWKIPSSAYCLSKKAEEGAFCMSIWPRALYLRMPEFAGIAVDVPIVFFQYSSGPKSGKRCLEASFYYDEDATSPFRLRSFEKSLKLVGPALMEEHDCYQR